MSKLDQPEKGREIRSAPAIAKPSAPLKAKPWFWLAVLACACGLLQNPSRAGGATASLAAAQSVPFTIPMQRGEEPLRTMTIEEKARQLSAASTGRSQR